VRGYADHYLAVGAKSIGYGGTPEDPQVGGGVPCVKTTTACKQRRGCVNTVPTLCALLCEWKSSCFQEAPCVVRSLASLDFNHHWHVSTITGMSQPH
jgi:hypothetical protein